jgi:UDP-galactopyranose mutase
MHDKEENMGKSQETTNSGLRQPLTSPQLPDLICLSHLRWDSIYQRPHQVMRRFAKERRIFFFEEPLFDNSQKWLKVRASEPNIWVVTPHLPRGLAGRNSSTTLEQMIDDLVAAYHIVTPILWYYTPLALSFTHHLRPSATVYDCMNELSLFKGETSAIHEWEAQLFRRADLVFHGRTSSPESRYVQLPHMQLFPNTPEASPINETRFAANRVHLVGSYAGSNAAAETWRQDW